MANEADMSGSSSKLVEQAAPSAQFPPLQVTCAREGLNAEQLARDLKSFELKTTFEDVFPAEAMSVEEYLQQVHEMAMVSAVQEAQKDNVRSFNDYMMTVLEEGYLQGCWKDELGMAEIVSSKGRLLTTTGIVLDGKIYCSIEETLYMAEVGALHLLHDDICLSLKELYKMLSQGRYGCCWESFEVYKELKSLGYIVSRHGVPWTLRHLTKNDSILNEATTKTNLKSDSEYELFKSMHIDKVKPFFDVYAPNSKFRKSSPGNPNFVLCLTSSLPPSKQEISDLERRCNGIPLKLCNVEPGRISFFSFNTVELPILP